MHVLGDGQLGDLVAEQGEFGPNAPAAPRRILSCHPPDQLAKLGVEPRTAHRLASGLPVPVALEASAVPGQHRGGLDDDETGPPGGCPSPKRHPTRWANLSGSSDFRRTLHGEP